EPSGIVSEPLTWRPRAPSEVQCAYSLSDPLSLPPPASVAATASGREISFSYDVNLDGISDVFVRSASNGSPGASSEEQSFELWVSELSQGQLRYRHEPCASLDSLSAGRRFFVRDINGDQVPDLVVAMRNGVQALVNTTEGWVNVLDYEWTLPEGSDGWASIL